MRILHIVPYLPKASGVTTFVVENSDGLQEMGVEQVVVVKDRQHFDVASSRTGVPRIGVAEALERIGEFNVVHLHGIWPPFMHRFVVAARHHHVPIVWSLHGMLSPWAMKFKWWKKALPWLLWQKRDLKSAAILHVTSEKELEWVRTCGFKNQIVNIPLGTNLPETVPERRHEKKTLLFVGRINPVKGLENLIQAWKLAQCADWKLRLVGTDEAKYTGKLVALAQSLSLQSSIEFPGPKFGKDLDAEYQNADVLVLPSFTENFGGVVVDALAWGLPVITSKGTPWSGVAGLQGCRVAGLQGRAEGRGNRSTVEFVNQSISRRALAEKKVDEWLQGVTRESLVTIEVSSRGEKKPPRLVPLTEAVQTVVHHQTTAGSYPSDTRNISNSLDLCNGLPSCVGNRAGLMNSEDQQRGETPDPNSEKGSCEAVGVREASGETLVKPLCQPSELSPQVDSPHPSPSTSTSHFDSHSRCGFWVSNDPETLAKTLHKAMSLSDAERRQMGEVGREWIRRDFSWESVGAKMKAAYEWLLDPEHVAKPEWVKVV